MEQEEAEEDGDGRVEGDEDDRHGEELFAGGEEVADQVECGARAGEGRAGEEAGRHPVDRGTGHGEREDGQERGGPARRHRPEAARRAGLG